MVYFLSVTGCNIILKKFAKRMIWTWKWWMQWFITSIAYFEFTYNNGKYPLSKWGNMYILQNIDQACTTNNLAKYYKMLNPEFLKCESVSLSIYFYRPWVISQQWVRFRKGRQASKFNILISVLVKLTVTHGCAENVTAMETDRI